MSVNIATEARRISDARGKLKSIIDAQAQAQAQSISPDNLKFQTNATMVQSDKLIADYIPLARQYAKPANTIVTPLSPLEPDMDTMTLWMPFDNIGMQPDLAYMGNTGNTQGCVWLDPGPPDNANSLMGGTRALRFDGSTSFLDVPDSETIRMPTATATGGFSFCCRINIESFTPQIDINWWYWRCIANKTDPDTGNRWMLHFNPNGDLLFNVKRAGSGTYRIKYAGMQLHTWYDIVATYSVQGNVLTIYRNNVPSTTVDTQTNTQFDWAITPEDYTLHIGRSDYAILEGNEYGLGSAFDSLTFDPETFNTSAFLDPPYNTIPHSTIFGAFHGHLYDLRLYQIPLSPVQVGNLYTNKFSISSIPAGQAGNAGYCLSRGP